MRWPLFHCAIPTLVDLETPLQKHISTKTLLDESSTHHMAGVQSRHVTWSYLAWSPSGVGWRTRP